MRIYHTLLLPLLFLALVVSSEANATSNPDEPITVTVVETAQQAWGEGIVSIGQVYTNGGDYTARAMDHILQNYANGANKNILFKQTLAAEDKFRGDFGGALSFFVGTEGSEDGGFAIAPYTNVRWENEGTVISEDGGMAVAMGNYFFTTTEGNEVKVEYTFAYAKDRNGDLEIVLHHSSLPYSP